MLKTQNVIYKAVRIGAAPPLVEPITYPLNTNIMTSEYFTAIDAKATTISPEYDIDPATIYLTDYIDDGTRDYNTFLTGEFWGMPRDNDIIFRLTQPEELSKIEFGFANTSNNPTDIDVFSWNGASWDNIASASNLANNSSPVITVATNSSDIFKIELRNGSSNYYHDPNKFKIELR